MKSCIEFKSRLCPAGNCKNITDFSDKNLFDTELTERRRLYLRLAELGMWTEDIIGTFNRAWLSPTCFPLASSCQPFDVTDPASDFSLRSH